MPAPELLAPPDELPALPPELLDGPPELPPEDPLDDDPALPPPEELLDELLEGLLEGRLPDEPLDPGLLGEGIEAEGIEGVVGVLAEGHPINTGKVRPMMIKCLILALFMWPHSCGVTPHVALPGPEDCTSAAWELPHWLASTAQVMVSLSAGTPSLKTGRKRIFRSLRMTRSGPREFSASGP